MKLKEDKVLKAQKMREYRAKKKVENVQAEKKTGKRERPVKMTRAQTDAKEWCKALVVAKKREQRARLTKEEHAKILAQRRKRRQDS